MNTTAVVLAGGKGTRMNTDKPKVLHEIAKRPMIYYTIENLTNAGLTDIVVVVSPQTKDVEKALSKYSCRFALQPIPLGTADALRFALPHINSEADTVLVVNGDDSSFYKAGTLQNYLESHRKAKATASILTSVMTSENKLGKVIRVKDGRFKALLEAKEYEESGEKTNEINCGAYIFDLNWVNENIDKVPLNQKGEYYITDLLNIAKDQGKPINMFPLENSDEWVGVNTQEELKVANEKMEKVIQKA